MSNGFIHVFTHRYCLQNGPVAVSKAWTNSDVAICSQKFAAVAHKLLHWYLKA